MSSNTSPSHGYPGKQGEGIHAAEKPATSDKRSEFDPTTNVSNAATQGGLTSSSSTSPAELSGLKVRLRNALRQYPDFPTEGILFEDIMPIFSDYRLHADLIKALELQIQQGFSKKPDVIVGLESRGFLFGPSLALSLGAAFVPVRKQGKLPGKTEVEGYEKEYGTDFFEMQSDAIKQGQTVLIVDDIMATGGSAKAAGNLVAKIGGNTIGYLFIMELEFLHGRDKLNAPVVTLLSGQDSESRDLPLGQTKESADEVKSVQDAGGAAASTRP